MPTSTDLITAGRGYFGGPHVRYVLEARADTQPRSRPAHAALLSTCPGLSGRSSSVVTCPDHSRCSTADFTNGRGRSGSSRKASPSESPSSSQAHRPSKRPGSNSQCLR
ncbi:hypothetical protein SUDANB140_01515 [Streptomyces sp. enrichment culture]